MYYTYFATSTKNYMCCKLHKCAYKNVMYTFELLLIWQFASFCPFHARHVSLEHIKEQFQLRGLVRPVAGLCYRFYCMEISRQVGYNVK